jgi:DNA repair protein RecO (recombination protein O)
MAAEKTLAIVLRVVDFSETSCVVTLFTRDFGKIAALAKGARRPKSPFESALDLMAVCRIVFLHKSSDALDLLTEAKLERRFRSAERSLSCLYAGYYVVELLSELTHTSDPHPELFDLADRTLIQLDSGTNIAPVVMHFELNALRVLGHLPLLGECVGCSKQIPESRRIAFGQLAGGVLCQQCRVGQKQVVNVSTDTIHALSLFSQPGDADTCRRAIEPRLMGEMRGLLNQYFNNLLGHRPRTQKLLTSVLK